MNSEKETIYLKPLSFTELESNYVSWLNDKIVCKYNSHGDEEYTPEMAKKYILSLKDNKAIKVFAVYLIENDCHIGNISLQKIDFKNKSAEIALLFGEKEYWGKGYATEATEIIIELAKHDFSLHRLYLGTNIDNIAMQKISEKLGFQKEGILKEAQLKNGKFVDNVIYGLILND